MKRITRVLLLCWLVMLPAPKLLAQATATAEQKDWIVNQASRNLNRIKPEALSGLVYAHVIGMLQPLDFSSRAEVMKRLWAEIKDGVVRTNLLSHFISMGTNTGEPCNPHLLEILHMAATDRDHLVRQVAYQMLPGISFKAIEKPDAYAQWYESVKGKSLEQILRENAAAIVHTLKEGKPEERAEKLRMLSTQGLDVGPSRWSIVNGERVPMQAYGLTGLRLRILREAKILNALAYCMRSNIPNPTALQAASLLYGLVPDAALLKQIEPDLRRLVIGGKDAVEDVPLGILSLLTQYTEPWAINALSFYALKAVEREDQKWQILGILRFYREPHLIPTLIAMMEKFGTDWEMRQIQEMLEEVSLTSTDAAFGRMAQAPDPEWWRTWWEDNRSTFPKSLRTLEIPSDAKQKKLMGRVNEDGSYSYPQTMRKCRIDNDAARQFNLIASGTLVPPGKEKFTPDNVLTALPKEQRPSLMVVLCDTKRDLDQARYGWHQVCHAQGGKLVVALVVPPGGKWTTRKEGANGPTAVESFTGDIVRYLQTVMPLDTSRIYLYGEGTGGMAAYACSLDSLTPFTGFSVFASAFRSAQLPPVVMAKGRRYFLQHDPQDAAAPIFLAKSAQIALQRAGASVKLVESKMADPANRASTQEQITASLQWLEAPSPPKQ